MQQLPAAGINEKSVISLNETEQNFSSHQPNVQIYPTYSQQRSWLFKRNAFKEFGIIFIRKISLIFLNLNFLKFNYGTRR